MWRRLVFDIKGWFSVHARINRRVLFWMGLFCLAGFIIGFITILNPLITVEKIRKSMIDPNLLNVIHTSDGFGKIVFARLLDFVLVCAFVFLIGLTSYTALLAFVYISFRASTIVINLYWVIAKFGVISGMVLFLVYLFFLILLLLFFAVVIIYILKYCAQIRRNGFRHGINWKEFWHGLFIFFLAITVIAVCEGLVYWLILSKFIFLVAG